MATSPTPAPDPNNPNVAAADVPPAEAPVLLDPKTGQPIAATATMTFADWCALDPDLLAADQALYASAFPAPVLTTPVTPPPGSAFARWYGSGAEQLMDRATMELRMNALKAAVDAGEVPPAAAPPPQEPAPASAQQPAATPTA